MQLGLFLFLLCIYPLGAFAQSDPIGAKINQIAGQGGPTDPHMCEDTSSPIPIMIQPIFDEPHYDYNEDIGALQQLAHDAKHNVHGGHEGLSLGLTQYRPFLGFRVPVNTLQFPDGTGCARVEKVEVEIGYKDVVVYIPRNVPQGSCGFNEVMGHEQKHIAVNRALLQEYVPIMQDRLQEFLRTHGLIRERDTSYAVKLMNEQLQAILDDVSNQMVQENSRRQQLVDSPQEYARVSAACNGQLQQDVRQYYHGGR